MSRFPCHCYGQVLGIQHVNSFCDLCLFGSHRTVSMDKNMKRKLRRPLTNLVQSWHKFLSSESPMMLENQEHNQHWPSTKETWRGMKLHHDFSSKTTDIFLYLLPIVLGIAVLHFGGWTDIQCATQPKAFAFTVTTETFLSVLFSACLFWKTVAFVAVFHFIFSVAWY